MTEITNPVEGLKAIQSFLMNRVAPLPDDVRSKLLDLIDPTQQTSPVQAAYDAAELIFGKREYDVGEGDAKETKTLPAELLEIGAQLATMLAGHKLFAMHVDNRGYAIAAAIRTMPDVASEPPVPATLEAPEPLPEYLPPAEAPPVPDAEAPAMPDAAALPAPAAKP